MLIFDIAVFLSGWAIAQLIFSGYEAHVPWLKRLEKVAVIGLVLVPVQVYLGRPYFYGLLGLMTLGIAILHGYWFHYRHGIHWRTAEPRDKYLALISKNKTPAD
ncbi:MAG: hypothetical protein QNJ45_04635 [Ardenticatenaceae bacterium]|nr:hypothetical protein [Ardenticatenaceae bacterium]